MAEEDKIKIKEYSHVVHVTLSNYKTNGADWSQWPPTVTLTCYTFNSILFSQLVTWLRFSHLTTSKKKKIRFMVICVSTPRVIGSVTLSSLVKIKISTRTRLQHYWITKRQKKKNHILVLEGASWAGELQWVIDWVSDDNPKEFFFKTHRGQVQRDRLFCFPERVSSY